MLLVDSSVWIDFFNGKATREADYLEAILGRDEVIVGDLILPEVLQGFKSDKDFKQARELLLACQISTLCYESIALKSAENFRKLRKKGVTVRKTIDTIIATWCIENHVTLLYSDKDFIPFTENLKLSTVSFYKKP